MAIYPSSAACSSERAHDPGRAMTKGAATEYRFAISESLVSQILARVPASRQGSYRVAGMVKFDVGYFYLGIPLWFTFVSTYVVVTNARLILADRTLWRGLVNVVDIPFEDIYCLVFNDRKKKVYIRLRSGNMIDFAVSTRAFLKAIVNAADGRVNSKLKCNSWREQWRRSCQSS